MPSNEFFGSDLLVTQSTETLSTFIHEIRIMLWKAGITVVRTGKSCDYVLLGVPVVKC